MDRSFTAFGEDAPVEASRRSRNKRMLVIAAGVALVGAIALAAVMGYGPLAKIDARTSARLTRDEPPRAKLPAPAPASTRQAAAEGSSPR